MPGVESDRILDSALDDEALVNLQQRGFFSYRLPSDLWLSDPNGRGWPWSDYEHVLEYRYPTDPGEARIAAPDGTCLETFVRLDEGPADEFPDRVLAFARMWGPLGICRHQKPAGHHTDCKPLGADVRDKSGRSLYWEPIADWARYVRHVSALFSLGVELRQELPGLGDDWQRLEADGQTLAESYPERTDFHFGPAGYSMMRTIEGTIVRAMPLGEPYGVDFVDGSSVPIDSQKTLVAAALDKWDEYGGVRKRSVWRSNPSAELGEVSRPQQIPVYRGLPGVLAIELRTALESEIEPTRCFGCGRPTSPARKPRYRNGAKERTWCKMTEKCDQAAQVKDHRRRLSSRG